MIFKPLQQLVLSRKHFACSHTHLGGGGLRSGGGGELARTVVAGGTDRVSGGRFGVDIGRRVGGGGGDGSNMGVGRGVEGVVAWVGGGGLAAGVEVGVGAGGGGGVWDGGLGSGTAIGIKTGVRLDKVEGDSGNPAESQGTKP